MWEALLIAAVFAALAFAWLRLERRRRRPARALEYREVLLFRLTEPGGGPHRHIGIVTGDLRRVRGVDVWVNSENTMMRMARFEEFSVSSIIRYEGAGRDAFGRVIEDSIADELARKVGGRGPVPPATVIITGPGELSRKGVRHIAHVAAVHGEPGAGFRQIREVGPCLTNTLTELDRLGEQVEARTVLFPLLGVGQGGGALRPTVRALLNAATDYFAVTPESQVETVLFLAFTDAELKCCKRVFARHPHLSAVRTHARVVPLGEETGARAPAASASPPRLRRKLQIGIAIDVVRYGSRTAPAQEAVQRRLAKLSAAALTIAVGSPFDQLDHQWTGDGMIVFLPSDTDPTVALPSLAHEMARMLAEDNRGRDDRIRLRMAIGVGITAPGTTGFAGPMVIDINRLVNSEPLREAMDAAPDADLAILLSEQVHAYLVQPGYLKPQPDDLRLVHVTVKEFDQPAWLWIPRPP